MKQKPYHRIIADSNKKFYFYSFLGEFKNAPKLDQATRANQDKKSDSNTPQYYIQTYEKRFFNSNVECYSSNYYYRRINSYGKLSYNLYPSNRFIFRIELKTLNDIVNFVDYRLSENNEYNLIKLKYLMNIKDNHQDNRYIKPGRVNIYNLDLMTYFDGKDWNKFTLGEINYV